jgi:regulator of RNase E activity RraA
MREDLDTLKNWVRDDNPQRQVCEEILPGEVLVIEAREDLSCGTMGGMLVARMFRRGAAGIVSDGPFRDTPFIASLDMPAYSVSMNANTNLISHHPEAMDVAITCGGVHVRVGDIAVGDQENVIIIPHAIVEDVAREAYRKEREEAFIERQILEGASLIGTYPMNEATRAKLAAEGGDDDGSG